MAFVEHNSVRPGAAGLDATYRLCDCASCSLARLYTSTSATMGFVREAAAAAGVSDKDSKA